MFLQHVEVLPHHVPMGRREADVRHVGLYPLQLVEFDKDPINVVLAGQQALFPLVLGGEHWHPDLAVLEKLLKLRVFLVG